MFIVSTPFVFSLESSFMTTFRWVYPTQLNLSRNSLTHARPQWCVSMVILNLPQLTRLTIIPSDTLGLVLCTPNLTSISFLTWISPYLPSSGPKWFFCILFWQSPQVDKSGQCSKENPSRQGRCLYDWSKWKPFWQSGYGNSWSSLVLQHLQCWFNVVGWQGQ